MKIDLGSVWRDMKILNDIRSEIKRQSFQGWMAWELLLPPELAWPMFSEISEGMMNEWSPMLDGIGISIGEEHEVAIRFVLPKLKVSPVMVRSIEYRPSRACDVEQIEVRHGAKV